MNKIIVLDYDKNLISQLKRERIIVHIKDFSQIEQEYGDSRRDNDVIAMYIEEPFLSVSQIDFNPRWENIPLVIKAYNLGDYHSFLNQVNSIRHLNIRIYLSSTSEKVYTELKIMASTGIDCGLWIDGPLDDEKFMDLASYTFMSPVKHASIEPFDNILRNLYSEKHDNFDAVYFNDKAKFIHLDNDSNLSVLNMTDDEEFEYDVQSKMECHYKHFLNLDKCSKCQAYKICNHKLENLLSNCENTMEEVYEYAEMRHDIDNNQSMKTICQL